MHLVDVLKSHNKSRIRRFEDGFFSILKLFQDVIKNFNVHNWKAFWVRFEDCRPKYS